MTGTKRLATVLLDGCFGCHMSLLDIDEGLLDLAELADLVYSPLVDMKFFPEMVDVALVEGAVGSEEDYTKIRRVRMNTEVLVSLGDCAVTANVPGMRNLFTLQSLYQRSYLENADFQQQIPDNNIPKLRRLVVPVHQVVDVDLFVPGCPPSAETIFHVVTELLHERIPDLTGMTRFGA
jgi:NAD-reducing hydrogenase small subunit